MFFLYSNTFCLLCTRWCRNLSLKILFRCRGSNSPGGKNACFLNLGTRVLQFWNTGLGKVRQLLSNGKECIRLFPEKGEILRSVMLTGYLAISLHQCLAGLYYLMRTGSDLLTSLVEVDPDQPKKLRTIKKVLLFFMLPMGGPLVYILYVAMDATISSEMISSVTIPIKAICVFFGFVHFIIVRKEHA